MGASESKRIDENLEEEYKSVRKYYDEFYGEMTVIENKKSKAQYGKI